MLRKLLKLSRKEDRMAKIVKFITDLFERKEDYGGFNKFI